MDTTFSPSSPGSFRFTKSFHLDEEVDGALGKVLHMVVENSLLVTCLVKGSKRIILDVDTDISLQRINSNNLLEVEIKTMSELRN